MFAIISMLLTFKSFLILPDTILELLEILAILVLVSYKPVSYDKTCTVPTKRGQYYH